MRLLEAIAPARLAAALPARFRLDVHGLPLVRRGTPLQRPIPVAFAAIAVSVSVAMAEAALVAPEGPVVAAALKAALMARRLMMLR